MDLSFEDHEAQVDALSQKFQAIITPDLDPKVVVNACAATFVLALIKGRYSVEKGNEILEVIYRLISSQLDEMVRKDLYPVPKSESTQRKK